MLGVLRGSRGVPRRLKKKVDKLEGTVQKLLAQQELGEMNVQAEQERFARRWF